MTLNNMALQSMSSPIRHVVHRLLSGIRAMVGARRAADADRKRSGAEQPCDSRTIDRRIEDLGSASDPERAVDELVALGEPALRRLLDVFDNEVSVPRGRSDRHASTGRNRAPDSAGKTVSRRGFGILPDSQLSQPGLEPRPEYVGRQTARSAGRPGSQATRLDQASRNREYHASCAAI